MTENDQPTILVCATTWWPLSARMAMALSRSGCTVSAVCPPGHPLRLISGVKTLYPYRGIASLRSLRSAIRSSNPTLIVPCDDGVVWQLHQLHSTCPDLRALIERSLGCAEAFTDIRGRGKFLKIASDLGIRVPVTHGVDTEADLNRHAGDYPAVLKMDGTWGGSGVEIVRSREEAHTAFRRFSKPKKAITAWKRLLVNRDPLALWMWQESLPPSITIQQYIPGRPANSMFVCRDGEVLGVISVEVLTAQGATGAATVVRWVENPEMEQAACLIARRFKLNGFHGLDYVIDNENGLPHLIEMNPRCTQLGHLSVAGKESLASAMAATLMAMPAVAAQDSICNQRIAFFPQAIAWNPNNPDLKCGYHDVPWEEPKLMKDLLRDSWPERRLLARIYHRFQGPQARTEVRF